MEVEYLEVGRLQDIEIMRRWGSIYSFWVEGNSGEI